MIGGGRLPQWIKRGNAFFILSKFQKLKTFRLMTLKRLLLVSSLALEYGSSRTMLVLFWPFKKSIISSGLTRCMNFIALLLLCFVK